MPKISFILYKIYYKSINNEDVLVYIGRTKQPMNARLHAHFFKKPMVRDINIFQVSKIEYADFNSEADMNVAEIILINRYKPSLNKDDKAADELTLDLPDFPFKAYECPHIERWKREISERDTQVKALEKKKRDLIEEQRSMRKKIFSNPDLSSEEKTNQWTKWLVDYYEPALDRLQNRGEFFE